MVRTINSFSDNPRLFWIINLIVNRHYQIIQQSCSHINKTICLSANDGDHIKYQSPCNLAALLQFTVSPHLYDHTFLSKTKIANLSVRLLINVRLNSRPKKTFHSIDFQHYSTAQDRSPSFHYLWVWSNIKNTHTHTHTHTQTHTCIHLCIIRDDQRVKFSLKTYRSKPPPTRIPKHTFTCEPWLTYEKAGDDFFRRCH